MSLERVQLPLVKNSSVCRNRSVWKTGNEPWGLFAKCDKNPFVLHLREIDTTPIKRLSLCLEPLRYERIRRQSPALFYRIPKGFHWKWRILFKFLRWCAKTSVGWLFPHTLRKKYTWRSEGSKSLQQISSNRHWERSLSLRSFKGEEDTEDVTAP